MVKIKDIAEAAGVSVSTVSRALNNQPGIGAKKRAEIQALAKEMEYSPDIHASILAGKRAKLVGVIVPDVSGNYFAAILEEIEILLKAQGFSLLTGISQYKEKNVASYIDVFCAYKVDAVVIVGPTGNHIQKEFEKMKKNGIPFVLLHTFVSGFQGNYVRIDDKMAYGKAVQYLKELGHKKIGYLTNKRAGKLRMDMIKNVLREQEIECNNKFFIQGTDMYEEGGYTLMKKMLANDDLPTAIFCGNDYMAMGAMHMASQAGLRVPQDISFIGYDNIREVQYIPCTLTTFAMPIKEMAVFCKDILIKKIFENEISAIQHIILTAEFIIRESTGAVG